MQSFQTEQEAIEYGKKHYFIPELKETRNGTYQVKEGYL